MFLNFIVWSATNQEKTTNKYGRTLWSKLSQTRWKTICFEPFTLHLMTVATVCVCVTVAQKIVANRKKQQLSIGPCKSLPNSPSHSSVCAPQVSAVHISQVRGHTHFAFSSHIRLTIFCLFVCIILGRNISPQ